METWESFLVDLPVDHDEGPVITEYRCPKCGKPMRCLEFSSRPSWKITMTGHAVAQSKISRKAHGLSSSLSFGASHSTVMIAV